MKKSLIALFLVAATLIVFAVPAIAEEAAASSGLAFTSNGDGTCALSGIGTCTDKDIVIPSVSPDGDAVTVIEDSAFQMQKNITSVSVPGSVSEIKDHAFASCTSLKSITFENGLKTFGSEVFVNCPELAEAVLPNSVTSVGDNLFIDCLGLKKAVLSSGMKSVGKSMFFNCASLAEAVIPEGVESIKYGAFYLCVSLKSVVLPHSLKSVESIAFNNSGLTSVNLPENVTEIATNPFGGSLKLGALSVDKANTVFRSESNCIIEKATEKLVIACNTSVIPDGVTSIASAAFCGCESIATVNVPDSVTSIENGAFMSCKNLTNINMGSGIKTITRFEANYCPLLIQINCKAPNPHINYDVNVSYSIPAGCAIVWDYVPSAETMLISSLPNKTVYSAGDTFEAEGLELTVTGNGAIKQITSGYTLSDTSMPKPGVRTVTVTYDGMEATFGIVIRNEGGKKLTPAEGSGLVAENAYVSGVKANTTVGEITAKFGKNVKIFTQSGKEANDTDIIGTGCVIRLYDGVLIDEATVVVTGDLDGDGIITARDYVLTKRAFLKTYALSHSALKAARVSGGDEVTAKDYVLIKRVFLKTYTF